MSKRKNISLVEEAENNLNELAKRLKLPQSEIIAIALKKYINEMNGVAEAEAEKCYNQLSKSVELLEITRDYEPESWSEKSNEILELLNKAHDPLMYYFNQKILDKNPEFIDEDGEFSAEIFK